ncbi:MAG: D-glycero-beta-D-manno-heptose-7-phosphate kinase [Gemmatimonadota bacterium]
MDRLDVQRARQILEAATGTRALVVGDIMLDVYLRGSASRISPEAPVPVVHVAEDWTALGGAANVACNVAGLGARCDLIGAVGADEAAGELRRTLAAIGVDARGLVEVDDRPTTVKTRILARQHQVARYDREIDEDVEGETAERLAGVVETLVAQADAVILEDYDKGVLVRPVIEAALDAARRRGVPVVVDPKARHFFDYGGATVLKPNLSELGAALRAPVLAHDHEWMDRTRRHLDCGHLLVTLGEEGMSLVTEDGEHLHVPAVARSVYDVSGAGDTVSAMLAVGLAAGASIAEAAVLASHAAGMEVGKAGVATVSPDEILDSIKRMHDRP